MLSDSPKTGLRFCALFPELFPYLDQASRVAPEGKYCIHRYRHAESNLRTQLRRIIERAGFEPWEKTFVNLRASRRTELQECFPDHVIDAWLGHSSKVAAAHHLQVTDEHWSRGATELTSRSKEENGGPAGGPTRVPTGGPATAEQDPPQVFDTAESQGKELIMVGCGEQWTGDQHPGEDSNLRPAL